MICYHVAYVFANDNGSSGLGSSVVYRNDYVRTPAEVTRMQEHLRIKTGAKAISLITWNLLPDAGEPPEGALINE